VAWKAGGRGICFLRIGEHLPARQDRLGLGTGDTNAEPAEAVDNQCVDRHGAVIIATCNVGTGQLHLDGLAVLQFIHG